MDKGLLVEVLLFACEATYDLCPTRFPGTRDYKPRWKAFLGYKCGRKRPNSTS